MAKTKQAEPIQSPPKKQSDIYLVTFRGEYLSGNTEGGRSGFVAYETTVKMTKDMVEFNAQSIFAGVLAQTIMPKRFSDFRHLSTFNVVKTVREDGEEITNIKLLNRGELADLVERSKLPINLALYKDDEDLRQAILSCAKDKKKFLELQKQNAPKLIERDKYVAEALALNTDDELNGEDAAKTVNNAPSLKDVLDTKEQLDKKARDAARELNKELDPYDTPDTDENKKSYSGGQKLMTDKLDQDTFPDGRHMVDGKEQDLAGF